MIATVNRVPKNTDERINRRIQQKTEERIFFYSRKGPEASGERLRELDNEWDIERTVEALASSFTLLGLILSLTRSRRYLFFPVAVSGFLLQHAVQGWCPPIPVLRRLGFRTAEEIAWERYALKSLRGDFVDVPSPLEVQANTSAEEAIHATTR